MANLDIIEKEKLVDKSADVGAYFHAQLNSRFENDSFVGQVRGQGMLAAVQLMQEKESKQFFDAKLKMASQVTTECYQTNIS